MLSLTGVLSALQLWEYIQSQRGRQRMHVWVVCSTEDVSIAGKWSMVAGMQMNKHEKAMQ